MLLSVILTDEKGTHGRRCSQRLIEKRKRAADKSKHNFSPASPLIVDSTDKGKSSCPPPVPAPPPPPIPRTLPTNVLTYSQFLANVAMVTMCILIQKADRAPLSPRNLCTSPLARKPLRKATGRGQAHNLLDELKGSECRKRLRKTENIR